VDADKTGVYRGQCTELCGRDHAFMPIVVDVRNADDYEAWLKSTAEQQKQAANEAGTAAPAAG
jgi:cytochrome c oxidase subunit 2